MLAGLNVVVVPMSSGEHFSEGNVCGEGTWLGTA